MQGYINGRNFIRLVILSAKLLKLDIQKWVTYYTTTYFLIEHSINLLFRNLFVLHLEQD